MTSQLVVRMELAAVMRIHVPSLVCVLSVCRAAADPEGLHFQAAMQAQLEKINTFYRAKELQLEVWVNAPPGGLRVSMPVIHI